MRRLGLYCLFAALLALGLAGCDSNGDSSSEQAPPVIPAEAFALNTAMFNQAAKTEAGTHFVAAALRVVPVSAIVGANLIIPAAVTAAALTAQPVRDGATWTWTSSAQANQKTVTFSLSGTIDGPDILWSMKVSYDDGVVSVDEFELFTAETDLESDAGTWRLFYPIGGASAEVLDADFQVSDPENAVVTYSIPGTAEQHAGDSVRYETDGDGREFEWNQVAGGLNHLIVWDAATHAGWITATNYNDGERACWDENLDDATCSG